MQDSRALARAFTVCCRVLACWLGLLAATAPAWAEAAPRAVADLLFPQTRAWQEIDRTPALSGDELLNLKASLQQAYQSRAGLNGLGESEGCSFIERALAPSEAPAFHRLDIDHDGRPDVVYVGSAQCLEGDATVVWFGTLEGFVTRQPVLMPLHLLRVSAVGQQTVSIAQGCCGSPADDYVLGQVMGLRQGEVLSILKATVLPAAPLQHPQSFTAMRESRLRASPTVQDRYDESRSGWAGRAVFGNQVRRYLPGATGQVLARMKVHGRRWLFVAMATASNVRVSHDPYLGVRVGWLPEDAGLRFSPPP